MRRFDKDHGEERRIDTPETKLTLDSRPVLYHSTGPHKGDERERLLVKLRFLQQEVAFTYNENVRRIFEASCVESSWPVTKNQPALCRAHGCDALSTSPAVERGQKQDHVVVLDDALLLAAESAKSAKMDGMDGNTESVRQMH